MDKSSPLKRKETTVDLILMFIVSCIPFIWVYGGYVILGHDAGKPLDPQMHFLDRLSTWTHRYAIGADQTYAIAGFFIHGYEFILDKIGLSLSIAQGIEYATYFMGMGISIYLLVRYIFPNSRYAAIFAAIFYQVNHFVLQGWFIVERTKFSIYIALPLVILQIFKVVDKRISPLKGAIITSLVMFVLNGGGALPLYGSLLLVIPTVLILLVLCTSRERRIVVFFNLLKFVLYTVVISIALQSYWLFPYVFYISREFNSELVKYGAGSADQWIAAISENASFANILRLQGIQEWYANPHHPYAATFLNNIFFILLSYLLPIFAFAARLFSHLEERKIILIFSIISLISMLFMAGSHAPFGSFYLFLIHYLPGFIAFRTPYYKFAPGLWMSYAILIGYTIDRVVGAKFARVPAYIVCVVITLIIVIYSYPIVSTSFFTYGEKLSNRIKIPQYVYDYADWAKSPENRFNRILILPPHKPGSLATDLDWGYWSLAPINSLLDTGSYIDQNLTLTPDESLLVDNMYEKIRNKDNDWVKIANLLNIDGVLIQNDARPYVFRGKLILPTFYNTFIEKFASGGPIVIGKWFIYRVAKEVGPVQAATGYYNISKNNIKNQNILLDRHLQESVPNSVILNSDEPNLNLLKIADIIYPDCTDCLLSEKYIGPSDHYITNLPGSRFYFLKQWLEKYQIDQSSDIFAKVETTMYHTTKRLFEYDNLYVNNRPIINKYLSLKYYEEKLDQLEQLINKIQKIELSEAKVNLLVGVYNTLKFHKSSLENYATNDYDPDLTENIIRIKTHVNKIIGLISSYEYFTTDTKHKKYNFRVTSPGEYSVYLYTPSVSADPNLISSVDFESGGKKISATVDRSQTWQEIGSVSLSRDNKTADLIEQQSEIALEYSGELQRFSNDDSKGQLEPNDGFVKRFCAEIPLNTLKVEKYSFHLRAKSQRETKVWTFLIDSIAARKRIKKENGQYFKFSNNRPLDVLLNIEVTDPENFAYVVCQFDSEKQAPIEVESLKINRITSPILQFKKINTEFVLTEPRTVSLHKNTLTTYELTTEAGPKQLLLLDQRFNHNWIMTQGAERQSPRITNYYQNAWIIPATNKGMETQITYLPQKVFNYFFLVSFALALVLIIILFLIK